MRKLLLLLKTQLPTAFRGRTKKDGEKKSSGAGYTVLMIVSVTIIVAMVTFMFIGMGIVLSPMGQLPIILTLGIAVACVFCLFTTIYNTNRLLFCFQDYDLVMALPIKTSTVVASRILILYVWNLVFILAIMVPACAVYGYFAQPPAAFYILYVIGMLLAPLLPSILATLIGSLIAIISSHFKKKGSMNTIFTLLFLVVWMLFCFNMDKVIDQFAAFGPMINDMVTRIYPPAAWFTEGTAGMHIGMFLLYAGISIGAFFAFCAIVGHYFRQINSSLSADRTNSDFKMGQLKATDARKALLRKEFKRLTGSSPYFMNTCIGAIMAVVLSALVLISGGSILGSLVDASEMIGVEGSTIQMVVTVFLSFFMMLTDTTAASISLEGKNLWILRSAPVSGKAVLQAKLLMNFLIVLVASLISSTLLCLAFSPDPGVAILMYATPLAFGTFSTVFGQVLNLKYPTFDWINETKVVKQNKPIMILSIVGMVIGLVSLGLTFVGGLWVALIDTVVLFLISLVLYRSLMTKGAARFDSFAA